MATANERTAWPERVLPFDVRVPFTTAQALGAGLRKSDLTEFVQTGQLRRPIAGVYVAATVADTLALRAAALRLVVPRGAVVTDRSAGWLHGARMIDAPGDHLRAPDLSVFHRSEGCRLRNALTESGQRMMPGRHVVQVAALDVTTPLRTACDLGRLLRREQAFAALDSMLGVGTFDAFELWDFAQQFKGYRGVRQLRALIPWADARAESPAESIIRLRWLELGIQPKPELQLEVEGPRGWYRLDLGVRALRFAVEYDGEAYHGPGRSEYDERRRAYLRRRGWTILVVRRDDVFGPRQRFDELLLNGIASAREAAAGMPMDRAS